MSWGNTGLKKRHRKRKHIVTRGSAERLYHYFHICKGRRTQVTLYETGLVVAYREGEQRIVSPAKSSGWYQCPFCTSDIVRQVP